MDFIAHDGRDLIQNTTAASKNDAKQRVNEWHNGSARVINLYTFLRQPKQNKQGHHEGFIFIGVKRFLDEFQLVFMDRQMASKILIHFRIHTSVIFAWDYSGDRGQKN